MKTENLLEILYKYFYDKQILNDKEKDIFDEIAVKLVEKKLKINI